MKRQEMIGEGEMMEARGDKSGKKGSEEWTLIEERESVLDSNWEQGQSYSCL